MMTEEEIGMDEMGEENARLLGFLYACPVGLVEISSDGTIGLINPLAMQLLLRLDPAPSMNFFTTMAAYGPELRNLVESYSPNQGTVCESHSILVRAGTVKEPDLEVLSCTIIKLSPERYMVSLNDISKQVRQAQKLKEAESWFASLLDGANDFGVVSLDASGHIASVSTAISKQTGFKREDLIGRSLDFLEWTFLPEGALTVPQQLALAAREGWHLHEDWQRQKDGSRVWYQRLVAVRHDQQEGDTGGVSGYTVVLREGQQRSIEVHHLKQMLTRDHLTGTYNRMHFFEVAERECARKKRYAQPVSLLIVDIDLFKQVNDAHGHAAGDQVLKQFSLCCMSLLRPSDTMARIGGEEFAILLPATNVDGAKLFAERLRAIIGEMHVDVGSNSLHITGSFGCAELSDDCNLAAMMADADAALYEAKQAGRNRVIAKAEKS
jgi:diguanylate cyclase (GGDEF)-like protein/PAS domain S-box-containing protein